MGGGTRKAGGGKDPAAASTRGMEGKGTASTRLPFPKPPTLPWSLRCHWPQEPCLCFVLAASPSLSIAGYW